MPALAFILEDVLLISAAAVSHEGQVCE